MIPVPPPVEISDAVPFAHGESPRWSLVRSSDGVLLLMDRAPPRRLGPGRWEDRPEGRRLVLGDGSVTLDIVHALCPAPPGTPRTGLIAYLSVDRRRLPGCLSQDAPRPYPGR